MKNAQLSFPRESLPEPATDLDDAGIRAGGANFGYPKFRRSWQGTLQQFEHRGSQSPRITGAPIRGEWIFLVRQFRDGSGWRERSASNSRNASLGAMPCNSHSVDIGKLAEMSIRGAGFGSHFTPEKQKSLGLELQFRALGQIGRRISVPTLELRPRRLRVCFALFRFGVRD